LEEAQDLLFDIAAGRLVWSKQSTVDGFRTDGLFPPVATADGRFAAWAAWDFTTIPRGVKLAYRHLPSGDAGLLAVAEVRHVRAHPSEPVLFLSFQSGAIGRLDINGLRTFPTCVSAPEDLAVSPDGDILSVLCDGVQILDARSGSLVRSFIPPMPLQSFQFTANKNRLVGLRHYFLIPQPAETIGLFDATTGQMLHSVQSPLGAKRAFQWIYVNPSGDRIYAAVGTSPFSTDAEVIAIDGDTLSVLTHLPLLAVSRVVETHDGTQAVALLQPDPATRLLRAAIINLASNTVLGPWDIGYYWTPRAPLLVSVSPPLAPAVSVAVAAHQVTFDIRFPPGSPAASSYVIEAADAAKPDGGYPFHMRLSSAGSQLILGGVPSGNYRVRVRGSNAIGDGLPSEPVLVIVP
jgi:hypothetical protein